MIPSDRSRALVVGALVMLLVSAFARPASGDSDNENEARLLFIEGRRLAGAGDYAGACLKFEGSYKLDPGIGTNFNLADCEEHLGRTATAWMRFLAVASATRAAGQLEREQVARARAAALEPRLSRIIVLVPTPPPGTVIQQDGEIVPATMWGVATPIDPGGHTIEAAAPGRQKWSSRVEVPSAPETVSVVVPALTEESVTEPIRPLAAARTATAQEASDHSTGPGIPRFSAWTGALGAVAIVTGAIFALRFEMENTQAKDTCHTNGVDGLCADTNELTNANNLRDSATRDRTIAIIATSAGAAAIVAAGAWWWRTTHRAPPAHAFLAPTTFATGTTAIDIGVVW
jgi:hypothetical protein